VEALWRTKEEGPRSVGFLKKKATETFSQGEQFRGDHRDAAEGCGEIGRDRARREELVGIRGCGGVSSCVWSRGRQTKERVEAETKRNQRQRKEGEGLQGGRVLE